MEDKELKSKADKVNGKDLKGVKVYNLRKSIAYKMNNKTVRK